MNSSIIEHVGNLPGDNPILFATISGAHLYGFPSPDSDIDVRGSFVLPVDGLLGLQSLQETITRTYEHDGREIDFVAHDLRKFVMLMLKRNGYVLEQVYSPLIVHGGAALEELRVLARGCIVRHLVHHYRGFAHNQIALMQKQNPPRLKDLLYVYRVLLTGIHVLQTGEIEANLRYLNARFQLPDIDDLIARKTAEGAPLTQGEAEVHRPRIDELLSRLDDAFEKSALPEKPTNFAALNEFVIRVRKEISQCGIGRNQNSTTKDTKITKVFFVRFVSFVVEKFLKMKSASEFWETNLIYKVVAGSQAYGLARASSDVDIRGVCIPPKPYLLGLSESEQFENPTHDVVIFALKKFIRLALSCNPNIIEILYVEPQHILFINSAGERLRAAREIFLTRRAAETFSQYAIAQLRRLERHHRWIVAPPEKSPAPEEFGGRPHRGRFKFPDSDAERAFRAAQRHWDNYQKWKRDRNPARAELEAKFGYDTKHAMHLLRLLRMGREILDEGKVLVLRPDAEWLRAVRDGLLSYEELLELARQGETELNELMKNSPLPEAPDVEAAENLLIELHENHLRETT